MARDSSIGEQSNMISTPGLALPGRRGEGTKPTTLPARNYKAESVMTGNREELIERIKRGERPTWVPSTNLQNLYKEEAAQQQHFQNAVMGVERTDGPLYDSRVVDDPFFGSWTESRHIVGEQRSALHRGDFNGLDSSSIGLQTDHVPAFTDSPTDSLKNSPPPWSLPIASTHVGVAAADVRLVQPLQTLSDVRRRAPSLGSSLASSFVLRTPTSPLAHAVNSNLDLTSIRSQESNTGTDTKGRRRTMPPNSFHALQSLPGDENLPNHSNPIQGSKREGSSDHSTHQPRRSLSSFTYKSNVSTPRSHIRRLSQASDSSPRYHHSMVGSFEESILRGRMSSPASQPFDFDAQIGVMGKGDCPSSLKCPAHVSVPFQAVFYHYPSTTNIRLTSDDAPSPYVGTIDLEHNLKPVLLGTKRKQVIPSNERPSDLNEDPRAPENTPIGKALARDAEKKSKKSTSPRMSLGGAYRVPEKGQLQIIIKNQHKTAVKLFLIPYDLAGMPPGTKTFIRQRSYSRGPLLEDSFDTTGGMIHTKDPLKDKHILRYLIHLRFCCPSKGKYYLYDQIRVVFANRVPDGKEKLENEIQTPDPKYSTFRPPQQVRKSAPDLVETGIDTSQSSPSLSFGDAMTDVPRLITNRLRQSDNPMQQKTMGKTPMPFMPTSMPFHIAGKATKSQLSHRESGGSFLAMLGPTDHFSENVPSASVSPNLSGALSPVQGFRPSTSTRSSPIPWGSSSTSSTTRSFSPTPLEVGDGLLSRQLRSVHGGTTANISRYRLLESETDEPFSNASKGYPDQKDGMKHGGYAANEEHPEQGDISLSDLS